MILAGDIGGTKTVLALYRKNDLGELSCEIEHTYASADHAQFNELLSIFLPTDTAIETACFGIAGPIVNQRCQTTNLPWIIDAQQLSKKLGTPQVKLLNDMEAMAIGMLNSPAKDMIELNPFAQIQDGNIAVIAAGTGLGEAILYWDGEKHHPLATEGGHTDFSAQTVQQDQFLAYLRNHFKDHVSWERVLSGDGFGYLYDFITENTPSKQCPAVPSADSARAHSKDRNAIISRLGILDEDPACVEVIRLFVELYGAEAGNLALQCLATGGVFIGGGIAPKIRTALEDGTFLSAFKRKGRFEKLLGKISIKLSLNQKTPLLGAANYFQ